MIPKYNIWMVIFISAFGYIQEVFIDNMNLLRSVPPHAQSAVINKLNTFLLTNLGRVADSPFENHWNEIFSDMNRKSNLKRLELEGVDISKVSPHNFSKAVIKLEELILVECKLTQLQVQQMFQLISSGKINLKFLRMETFSPSFDFDFSVVDPDTLAKALNKLESVEIDQLINRMLKLQMNKLFTQMNDATHLKKLDVGVGDVTSIDPTTLALAVNKLTEVSLNKAKITHEQRRAILRETLVKTSLTKLSLHNFHAEDFMEEDELLISEVRKKIKLSLYECDCWMSQ